MARSGRALQRARHGNLPPRRMGRGSLPAGLVRPGGGTILDAIGNTPLIMVDGIWVKLKIL